MSNRKVNTSYKRPSGEEINKYKDFDKLLSDFNAASTNTQHVTQSAQVKTSWFWKIGSAVVIGAIGVSAWVLSKDAESVQESVNETLVQKEPKSNVEESVVVQSWDLADLSNEYINLNNDLQVKITGGRTGYLDQVRQNGQEFLVHDQEKSKTAKWEVVLANNFKVKVEGKDGLELDLSAFKTQLEKVERPIAPQKANPNSFKFDIEIDPKDFPDIAAFKGVMFEIVDGTVPFKSEFYSVEWNDIQLYKSGNDYKMKLKSEEMELDYVVQPVLSEREYQRSMDDYNQKLAAYEEYEASLTTSTYVIPDSVVGRVFL